MQVFLLHFVIGLLVSLAVFLVFLRLSGERGTSLPVAPALVGFACGLFAVMLSPWATPAVLALHLGASWNELRQDRQDRRRAGDGEPGERATSPAARPGPGPA